MALELATYLNDLAAANPVGTDPKSQGDDHIRLIKQVLKNSFLNLSGAILVGGTDSGAANAYVLAATLNAYAANMIVMIKAINANTGASTLNINGLGAKSILRQDGTALQSGDIVAGQWIKLVYSGTDFRLLNQFINFASPPAIGSGTPQAVTGTIVTATTQFVGSGAGLTGTANSLSIGGNASTATNATNATTAASCSGNAASATTASNGVTKSKFDNSLSLATTEFVQSELGNLSGNLIYASSVVMPSTSVGNCVFPAVPSLTFTLPLTSSIPAGSVLVFNGNGIGCTIARQSTDIMALGNGSALTSLTLNASDRLVIVSNPGGWFAVGGEAAMLYSTAWNSNILGINQTLTNVTSSRAFGTTYTNSTGKPIVVYFSGSHNTNNSGTVVLNGSTLLNINGYGTNSSVSFIVPNGATYSIPAISGETISSWWELR